MVLISLGSMENFKGFFFFFLRQLKQIIAWKTLLSRVNYSFVKKSVSFKNKIYLCMNCSTKSSNCALAEQISFSTWQKVNKWMSIFHEQKHTLKFIITETIHNQISTSCKIQRNIYDPYLRVKYKTKWALSYICAQN